MDGWYYVQRLDRLLAKVAREYPGYTFVSRRPITSGLWLDVDLLSPQGQLVSRRLFF